MLSTLTTEQKTLMSVVRVDWITGVLGGDEVDKSAIRDGVNAIYGLLGKECPFVFVLDGPADAFVAHTYFSALKKRSGKASGSEVSSEVESEVRSKVRSKVESKVWSEVESKVESKVWSEVESKVWSEVWSKVRSEVESKVWSKVRSEVESKVWSEVESKVWSEVESKVESEVESKVWSKVRSEVESKVWSKVESKVWSEVESKDRHAFNSTLAQWSFAGLSDAGWLSFYDYFSRIGVIHNETLHKLIKAARSGMNLAAFCSDAVYVVKPPVFCNRDEEKRLHCTTGPALVYGDGFGVYCVHGVSFSKEDFDKHVLGSSSAKEVLALSNVEQRAAIIEHRGINYFYSSMNCKVIDVWNTAQRGSGQPTTLSLATTDLGAPIRLLHVEWWEQDNLRSSTLLVSNDCSSVKDAVASTWPTMKLSSPADYWDNLEKET